MNRPVRTALQRGGRLLRRYTGLTLVLYLVQFAVAGTAGFVITRILSSISADNLAFDRALAGELDAVLAVGRAHADLWPGLVWVALTAVASWAILSWYLIGGLIAVVREHPSYRGDTATTFGAGGARTFFPYLRLGLLSLVPYLVVVVVIAFGLNAAGDAIDDALGGWQFLGALAGGLAPGLLLLVVQYTVVDYARIDLAMNPGLASWRALLRSYRLVASRWQPLAHALLYWLVFALLSLVLIAVTWNRPLLGASGALSLFLIRQLVALARLAAKVALVGGQVELAEDLQRPPRRR